MVDHLCHQQPVPSLNVNGSRVLSQHATTCQERSCLALRTCTQSSVSPARGLFFITQTYHFYFTTASTSCRHIPCCRHSTHFFFRLRLTKQQPRRANDAAQTVRLVDQRGVQSNTAANCPQSPASSRPPRNTQQLSTTNSAAAPQHPLSVRTVQQGRPPSP